MSKMALISIMSDSSGPFAASSLRSRGSAFDSRLTFKASCRWSSSSYYLSMSTDDAPSWDWRSVETLARGHAHLPFSPHDGDQCLNAVRTIRDERGHITRHTPRCCPCHVCPLGPLAINRREMAIDGIWKAPDSSEECPKTL
jgi:hypothetical protein